MTREEFLNQLPDLVKDYQASDQVLAHVRHIDLLMIVGGTGVGKTSIIKRLGIPYVLSDTTRPIRPWEINGHDYFFRTDYEQLAQEIKRRNFVQVMVFQTGDFYGTRAGAFPEVGYAVYAVVSDVVPQFRRLGFNDTVCAFVTPPSFQVWMDRLGQNNIGRDQLAKRFEEAKRSFVFALNDGDTHFILNDDLGAAAAQTLALLNGRVDAEREAKARQAAQAIHQQLSA